MQIPTHIGIVMDGNGRWAEKRFLNKSLGHKAGADNLKKLSKYIESRGVKYLTVYAFSTENWSRSEKEVEYIMNLLRDYVRQYFTDSEGDNMKYVMIGDITKLAPDIQESIRYIEEHTKHKQGLEILVAMNYGGRDEIIRAAKKMFTDIQRTNLDVSAINEQVFRKYLDTSDYPDPELIIRTGGELRVSNFLTWESAYSEFYFTDVLWPDFNATEFDKAIETYNKRERRFGGRKK